MDSTIRMNDPWEAVFSHLIGEFNFGFDHILKTPYKIQKIYKTCGLCHYMGHSSHKKTEITQMFPKGDSNMFEKKINYPFPKC